MLRAASQHEAVREVRQRGDVRLASGVEPGLRGNGRRSTRLSIVSRIEAIEGPLARHLSALEHPGRSIAARAHDCKWHDPDNLADATMLVGNLGVSCRADKAFGVRSLRPCLPDGRLLRASGILGHGAGFTQIGVAL